MDAPAFEAYIIKALLRQSEREKVFAAFAPALDRPVSLRLFLQPPAPGSERRLAELAASLRHPHIVQIYQVGLVEGQLFLAQEELVETLAGRLGQQQVPSLEAVARQLRLLAGALDYAHQQGVIHGKLHPGAILLTDLDEPVLTDFGLAAIEGSLPAYQAPEQAPGEPVTVLSDLYALGLILYEWVTGHPLSSAEALAGGPETLPPPRTLNPELPPAAEQTILRALATKPEQRFASATELAAAFTLAVTGAVKPESRSFPAKIGRYEIIAELGRRGNLTVYQARDPRLERQVALKLLPAQFATDSELQLLFQREIELIAALDHHAIVQVYDFGEHEGQPFVVMPFLAGGTLALRLRAGPIEPQQFAPILARLAEALEAAHSRGIIHGQIKPDNILFDDQGQAYLSDFTLFSTLTAVSPSLSDQGDLAELTPYMSPEQARTLSEGMPVTVDSRSDIYALGVILFEVLSGETPYRAGAALEIAKKHLTEPIPRLPLKEARLRRAYQPIIDQALAKAPAERYPSAARLARHFQEVVSGRWYLAHLSEPGEEPAPPVEVSPEAPLSEPSSASSRRIGRYYLERELGRGGMAVVYLAYDPQLKRRVAVKILPPQFMQWPHFRDRFQREAELVARLQHPAIVSIYDFGEAEGQPFIVMPYLSGGTLAERLQEGALKLPALAPIIDRVAAALDEAHTHHIIHHDVKPGNIIFNARGEAFLSDFGIAVLAEATAALSEKDLGFTPKYVSPERVRAWRDKNSPEVDGRSDIYALGVVLFEALAGRPPFKANSPLATALAHTEAPIPPIGEIEAGLAQAGQKIIERVLAKSPADRYQTARELAQAVKDLASGRWILGQLLE